MEPRDLTPDEARAEIEAFMGPEWSASVSRVFATHYAEAAFGAIRVEGSGYTYRAAVDALKAAWRDAVRPWIVTAVQECDDDMTTDWNVARVLKEDSK